MAGKNQDGKFRFRPFDAALLLAAVCAAAVSAVVVYGKPAAKVRLIVTAPSGQYIYQLDGEKTVEISGALGASVIQIADGSARFLESACDNKTCVRHGFLKGSYDFAACLPNAVFLMLQGDASSEPLDAIAN